MVEERLAACANVVDGMTSVYRWQGKLASETETVLPVIAGNPAFLDYWIAQETA